MLPLPLLMLITFAKLVILVLVLLALALVLLVLVVLQVVVMFVQIHVTMNVGAGADSAASTATTTTASNISSNTTTTAAIIATTDQTRPGVPRHQPSAQDLCQRRTAHGVQRLPTRALLQPLRRIYPTPSAPIIGNGPGQIDGDLCAGGVIANPFDRTRATALPKPVAVPLCLSRWAWLLGRRHHPGDAQISVMPAHVASHG